MPLYTFKRATILIQERDKIVVEQQIDEWIEWRLGRVGSGYKVTFSVSLAMDIISDPQEVESELEVDC